MMCVLKKLVMRMWVVRVEMLRVSRLRASIRIMQHLGATMQSSCSMVDKLQSGGKVRVKNINYQKESPLRRAAPPQGSDAHVATV